MGSSVAVLVYNVAGMYVTEEMGAAARTVVENARTLLVWVVGPNSMTCPVVVNGIAVIAAWRCIKLCALVVINTLGRCTCCRVAVLCHPCHQPEVA